MPTNPKIAADPPLTAVRSRMLEHEWFRSIPEAFQEALLAHGKSRTLGPGKHLFEASSQGAGLYCVLAGSISVQARHRNGDAPVLIVLGPGHWFGELSMLDRHERTHDAVALDAATIWHVRQAAIEAWLDEHPKHWRDVARLLAGKLRVAFSVIDSELRGEMTSRVAKRLLMLSSGWGWRDASPSQRLALSQEVLASMLGGSRSSINKALQELKELGAIRLTYGAIEIRDLRRLMAACGDEFAID